MLVSQDRQEQASLEGVLGGLLTRSAEGASDLDLWSIEVRLLPGPQVILNLHDGLQPLRWPLSEVVEALIILVTLNEIKPGKLRCCG